MSLVDLLERELYAAATARPPDSARYVAVLERAVRMCDADPTAAEVFDLAELYLDLSTEYSTWVGTTMRWPRPMRPSMPASICNRIRGACGRKS